jgi:hypothetical protein
LQEIWGFFVVCENKMSTDAQQHADPTVHDAAHLDGSVIVSVARLRQLEAFELRADLDAKTIALQQQQIRDLDAALKLEQARGEKHADALMHIARTCDERTGELKEQHAAALRVQAAGVAKLEEDSVALRASHAAVIHKMESTLARAELEIAALKAAHASAIRKLETQALTKLDSIHGAIAALQTLEIQPIRPDRRQFASWHCGRLPQMPATFCRAWSTALLTDGWKIDIDAGTGMRMHVTQKGYSDWLTLRSAAPLPRRIVGGGGAVSLVGLDQQQQQQQHQEQLPAYRVILEAYSDVHKWCYLGFVPSHRGCSGANSDGAGLNLGHTVRAVSSIADANCSTITPTAGHDICNYAGWCIDVRASSDGLVHPDTTFSGWTVMAPAHAPGTAAAAVGADEGGMKAEAAESASAYATTTVVPPVPPGSAVEFAVDYAAGTCRVAFYAPEAVSGGFVEAPHAKMELRFVATKEEPYIPARSVPTAEGSGVELYPAVETGYAGTIWRFAAA